jgi:hypothetical protein|tara:strand:+ start:127 stop:363 length:237 start_codon:yes stop_codon:yes gene_type:complete
MSNRKILTSKKAIKFELQLAEVGCIAHFLGDQSRNVEIWGNTIIGMEDWQAEILHRLAKEFKEAEHELHQFSLEGEVA